MRKTIFLILLLLVLIGGRPIGAAFDDPPTEWIDPSTGHRVIRLSREPGSASLYFHQNAYSPDGLFTEAGAQNTLKYLAAFNPAVKPADIKLAQTFDNSYAQKALAKYKR